MTSMIFKIQMFSRRREAGKWRIWGHGLYRGEIYTFWKLDRKHGFTFKSAASYSRGFDLSTKTAEQKSKGYQEVPVSRYYHTNLNRSFSLSVIVGSLHQSRRSK